MHVLCCKSLFYWHLPIFDFFTHHLFLKKKLAALTNKKKGHVFVCGLDKLLFHFNPIIMKTRNYLKIFSSVFFFAFIIAAFSSCSKDDGASLTGSANLMIVNGAEGSAPQDYYVDNSKVTASAVAYTQHSGYIT